MKWRLAGDSLVTIELGTTIDPRVHAQVLQLASALAEARVHGVTDIVPAYATIGVHFEPLVTDLAVLQSTVRRLSAHLGEAPVLNGRLHEIPVQYGGAAGPDLAEVAAFAGCTPEAVIERHSRVEYRVYLLGFVPGFAYLGTVDPSIAIPRRRVPRERVPAGAVGIAGAQTGVYPTATPGGWQIIGQTAATLVHHDRTPIAVLAPGDRVRFVPQ